MRADFVSPFNELISDGRVNLQFEIPAEDFEEFVTAAQECISDSETDFYEVCLTGSTAWLKTIQPEETCPFEDPLEYFGDYYGG